MLPYCCIIYVHNLFLQYNKTDGNIYRKENLAPLFRSTYTTLTQLIEVLQPTHTPMHAHATLSPAHTQTNYANIFTYTPNALYMHHLMHYTCSTHTFTTSPSRISPTTPSLHTSPIAHTPTGPTTSPSGISPTTPPYTHHVLHTHLLHKFDLYTQHPRHTFLQPHRPQLCHSYTHLSLVLLMFIT